MTISTTAAACGGDTSGGTVVAVAGLVEQLTTRAGIEPVDEIQIRRGSRRPNAGARCFDPHHSIPSGGT